MDKLAEIKGVFLNPEPVLNNQNRAKAAKDSGQENVEKDIHAEE